MYIENCYKNYKNKEVIKGIDFSFKENDKIIGLVGKNGIGKTTMMKILTGNINSFHGKRYNINSVSLGYLIEHPKLYMNKTGLYNLKFFANVLGGSYNKNFSEDLIKLFDMSSYMNKKVKNYSLGIKQKLAILIAVVNKPQYLILDEPTNGMDIDNSIHTLNLIKKLSDEFNINILISSHKLDEIESICNRVLFVNDGKIVKDSNLFDIQQDLLKIKLNKEDFDLSYSLIKSNYEIYNIDIDENIIRLLNIINTKDILKLLSVNNVYPIHFIKEKKSLKSDYIAIQKGGLNEYK